MTPQNRKDDYRKIAAELRYRAEEIARKNKVLSSKNIETLSPEEIQRLIHELQVHQIELEMQNEELLRTQSELDAAREHYFDLYDLAPVGYFTISEKGLILEANLTAASLLGVVREVLVNQPLSQFLLSEDQDIYYRHRKQLLKTGEPQIVELRMARNDKTIFWARLASTLTDRTLQTPSVCRIRLTDITEHKRISDTLRENKIKTQEQEGRQKSERKFRQVFDNANDAIFIFNKQGRMLEVNLLACERLGYTHSELISLTLERINTPEEVQHIPDRLSRLMERGHIVFETVHQRKDGFQIPTEVSARKITWDNQPAVISICRDLTERKRVMEALQKSEKKFQAVFNHAPVGAMLLDGQSVVLDCNQYLIDMYGVGRERYIGMNLLESMPEGPTRQYLVKTLSSDTGVQYYEGPGSSVLNGIKPYLIVVSEKIAPDLFVVIIMDITERKRTEEQLKESEDKFSLTFKSSPDAVNINRLDDGLYVDINEGFTRISGFTRDDVFGKTALELGIWQNPADRRRLVKGLREKGFYENLETQLRMKDGSIITGLMSARVISLKGVPHIISITRDITEHKKHEKERLKMEKLESLGVLAGGIAHDFNNILTGIMGNISFAKIFLDAAHESYKPLAEAEKAAVRAGELAHQLLTFARGGEPIKKVVSPQRLIHEVLSFVLHGSNVKGTVDIPDSIHAFEADEGQISQVFQNIIINATQAMPGGGILKVTAQNAILDDNNALSLPPGPYIRLTFADQGCGISDDDLKRIFDPYFTTKTAGIGLGLSSVHSIVSRHGGHFGVSSAVGKGTTLTIYLPSIGKVYTNYQAKPAEKAMSEHKGGSILVMDDEDMIRDMATMMLVHLGYEVTTCSDGAEAIELYKTSMEAGKPFSMVIMDLTIPGGLGGKQAAEQILSFFPKACLVVSSGYSNDPIMSNYREYGFNGAIAKPYSINNFKEVLDTLLTP
jgi:two-component system, cell cycle sensor histidine kinase and response regulator CckA